MLRFWLLGGFGRFEGLTGELGAWRRGIDKASSGGSGRCVLDFPEACATKSEGL
ncbi:MAG: hypothetical protein ACYST6_07675 [Planctomycetota bacterium]